MNVVMWEQRLKCAGSSVYKKVECVDFSYIVAIYIEIYILNGGNHETQNPDDYIIFLWSFIGPH